MVRAQDLEGEWHDLEGEGLLAVLTATVDSIDALSAMLETTALSVEDTQPVLDQVNLVMGETLPAALESAGAAIDVRVERDVPRAVFDPDALHQILQNLIDDVHNQFVASVAEGRELDEQAVRSIADGRIFSGRRAMELGLVDSMGNLQAAIDRAAVLAGLDAEPKIVYPQGKKPRFIDLFIEGTLNRLHYALQKQRSVGLQYLWPGFD